MWIPNICWSRKFHHPYGIASVTSHIKLIKTMKKVARLNALQLISERTVGNNRDEGIKAVKARKTKYPGNPPGESEKNLLYKIAPTIDATPSRMDSQ